MNDLYKKTNILLALFKHASAFVNYTLRAIALQCTGVLWAKSCNGLPVHFMYILTRTDP